MRSPPPLIPLLCVAAACALALCFFLRSSRAREGLSDPAQSGAAELGRIQPRALEGAQGALPPPEGATPAPRSQAVGTPAAPDAEPAAEARVEGLVLRPDGKPATLARVWRLGADGQPADSTVTDAQGAFAIQPAAPGRVQLYATHDEFAPSETSSFELAAGEQRSGLRLQLREYGRIRGLVLDAHEVPRAKIAVSCEEWSSNRALFAESDAAGRFEFAKVGAGQLLVGMKLPESELAEIRADAPFLANRLSRAGQERMVELAPGQTLEVVLGGTPAGGVRVFGRVRSGAQAAPHTWIWAESPSLEDWFAPLPRARTDEQGEYELWVPAPGSYRFHLVGAGGALDLARDESITGKHEQRVDFELPGGSISGRVVDAAGRALTEVSVALSEAGREAQPDAGSFAVWGPHGMVDAEGRFRFVNLPAGRYELRASPRSKPDAEAPFAAALLQGLELAAGAQLADVEIVLRPGCRIRGVVRGASQGLAAALRVFAHDASGGGALASARVDNDGSFVLRGLAEGNYALRASGGLLVSPILAPVQARAERDSEVELVLEHGARLFLRAKFAEGQHPPTLEVALRDRGYTLFEAELDPSEEQPLFVVLAPGSCEVQLSGPGGWKGSETVALEAGKAIDVEVLVRHAP